MSGRYDFTLRQGNTFARTMRFRDSRGLPVDLTGSVLTMSIANGPSEILRLSTATGEMTISAPASGEVTIALSASDTRRLPVGAQQYEIERSFDPLLTSPGSETTILTGMIVVQRGLNNDR